MAKKQILIVEQEKVNGPMTFAIEGQGSITVDPNNLSDDIKARLLDAGLRIKVSRAVAGKGNDPEAAWASVERVATALMEGKWNAPSAGGTSKKDVEREAVLAALRRVPPSVRKQVAEQLIADGAPITMEDVDNM